VRLPPRPEGPDGEDRLDGAPGEPVRPVRRHRGRGGGLRRPAGAGAGAGEDMTGLPPPPPDPGLRGRGTALAAFALTAVCLPGFFPPANNPNELSRIQAIVAFVDQGTFSIDRMLARYGDHEDKSVFGGRYYSNKAPGLIFAGAAVYRLLRFFAP